VACMFCHGELARHKPHPRYLTQFYLMVSAGGAVGGLFVALGAPRLFRTYLEMPIAVGMCAFLVPIVLWPATRSEPGASAMKFNLLFGARSILLCAAAGFAYYLGRNELASRRPYLLIARNFYGVLAVRDDPPDEYLPGQRVLIHGTINHGTELKLPNAGRIPTSYFGNGTGLSRAIRAKGEAGPLRIGILGLGAGVTAALVRPQDTLHYYEINPLVLEIATNEFDFLKECPADKKVFLGDGRLVLENMPASENLDILTIDAFSSDSIPVHLLTREAYQLYLRHLKPDAVLIFHISSRYLDLEPVVARSAAEMGWHALVVADDAEGEPYYIPSTYVVVSHSAEFFKHRFFSGYSHSVAKNRPDFRSWTDDYSNIIQILKK
jgi:hypothetical protein